jgi:hypothetical protein
MFCIILFVSDPFIWTFKYSPLVLVMSSPCLTFSYYLSSVGLDPVTIAVQSVSFGIIILSVLCQTVAYATSIHRNLDSVWPTF